MKILIAGDWHSELHEVGIFNAFKSLKHEPYKFSWCQYFISDKRRLSGKLKDIYYRFQNKYLLGPALYRLNNDFLKKAISIKPDLIFIYRGTHIWPSTLKKIKVINQEVFIVGYNNDDPFSPVYPGWMWRHFIKCVPLYDLCLAYRHHNLAEFKNAGAKRVDLLRSWYMPERNFAVELTPEDKEKFATDVVFAGHYENDGRLEILETIAQSGYSIKIYGPPDAWNKVLPNSQYLKNKVPVVQLWGEDYNKALCGARIALCFMSKLNRDTYTRRCFEIPATKTFMLAEYTQDLCSLYKEGVEAEFFRTKEELLTKINRYLRDDIALIGIANAGYNRLIMDCHDVTSRMKSLLDKINKKDFL